MLLLEVTALLRLLWPDLKPTEVSGDAPIDFSALFNQVFSALVLGQGRYLLLQCIYIYAYTGDADETWRIQYFQMFQWHCLPLPLPNPWAESLSILPQSSPLIKQLCFSFLEMLLPHQSNIFWNTVTMITFFLPWCYYIMLCGTAGNNVFAVWHAHRCSSL